MAKVTNWDKFKLLLWKNWTIQWNCKWELAIELLIPLICSLLPVVLRTLVLPKPHVEETYYPPLDISNLELLLQSIGLQSLLKPPEVKLVYSPNTSAIFDRIMQVAAMNLFIFQYQGYANAEDLEAALIKGNYLAGVQFNNIQDYPKKLSYALRFPCELRTAESAENWLTTRLFPKSIANSPRNRDDNDGGVPVGYLREGFIPIQHAIAMAYIRLASNSGFIPKIQMQRYPYPAYLYDLLVFGLPEYMGQIILLSYIFSCIIVTKNICLEKEKMLKEVMKIMGIQNWIHWTAWFVHSFIMFGISSLLITVIWKIKWSNNTAVFTYSSFTALLFFLLIYSLTCICFCFMIATIFSTASSAAAITGILMLLSRFPFNLLEEFYDDMGLAQKLGWCLAVNTAVSFGFQIITSFEGTGEGLQWSNMFSPVSVDDNMTLGAIILVMLASCVPFMVICLYIEQIYPGEFGVARKWNFPFTAHFWRGKREYKGVEDTPNEEVQARSPNAFEAEPAGRRVCVQLKSLGKRFDDKMAVQGLSLNMYEDEITVLLGHNGSGKTTTLSMLAGMYPPTSGTAIINGSDIRTNIEGARMSLGFCPQHNVLFDDLSVSDHIVFFSRVKGIKGEALQKEVDTYLKMIGLENKANVLSSKLSGGMKRKLSLCCALCGDTKVVLCDEPTSGMDPASRRLLWDLFHSKKIGRTFLITTHFMDEADVLGDRIAIMCEGELKCHGSSFFLKKKYGSGYNLICAKLENCNSDEVTALLGNYIPGIKPKSDIGAELSYELPDKYSPVFEEMFRSLEKNSERLNLDGYGISITSMEEVFMKVGAENANDTTRKEQSAIMKGIPEEDLESIQTKRTFSGNLRPLKGTELLLNQWHAMLLKKFLYTLRSKLLFVLQIMFPVTIVIIILIINTIEIDKNLPPMTMKLAQYPDAVTILEQDASLNNLAADAVEVRIANFYKAIANAGPHYTVQSTGSSSFTDYIIDLGKSIQIKIDSSYLAAATVAKGKITAWLNNQPLHTAPLTVNLVHNAIAKALIDPEAEITITNAPLPYSAESILNEFMGSTLLRYLSANICLALPIVTAFYILSLIKERDSRWKLMQFVGGVKVWTFWLTQFIWDMATFTIIALAIILVLACFQPKGFTQFSQLGRYFFIIILFGFSALPLTYLLSFLFKKPGIGFACVAILGLFIGIGMAILTGVLYIEELGTEDIAHNLERFFRIFPFISTRIGLYRLHINTATHEACNDALIAIQSDEIFCQLMPKCCNLTPYFDWEEPGVLVPVVYMSATGVIYFLIVIIIDYGIIKKMINKFRQSKKKPTALPVDVFEDDDVRNENQRILAMSKNEIADQNLVLDRVTKYYKKFLAVNDISLCIKHGECFGLLGVNGAGKTTLFKMIIGDESISSGSIYFKGMTLDKDKKKIYKEIGYCPQFDALYDELTGRETIKIYCLLRGIRKKHISQVSEGLGKSFDFMPHMDKETKAYSGGSKRKLSMALALIGNPMMIYLDEPTTAMDPVSRRLLWNIVIHIRDSGKSIILISHSMEECEALCTRLVIMVNGEFKCIGSKQHLKNKFSKGLILKIKVQPSTDVTSSMLLQTDDHYISNVKNFVEHEFPEAVLQEEYQGILTFYIPLASIKWSKIFGLMERNRKKLNIEDYSISQTTLEEIFLDFAKHQSTDRHVINVRPIPVAYPDADTAGPPILGANTDAEGNTWADLYTDSDTYADAASETENDTYADADP